MKRRVTAWTILGFLPLALAAPAFAGGEEDVKTWTTTVDGKEKEVRPATPTYTGDTGLFRLGSAYTLPKGKASFSLFRDNYDRDPKDVDVSIHGLSVGFGATSRLELFGSVGLQNRVNTDARFQGGFVNDYPFAGTAATAPSWQTGVGDVKLGAKFKLLDDYSGDGIGLAVRGFVKLPTADEAKGLGTGKASGGADVIVSKTLNRGADIHASIGYQINSDPDRVNIGNALNWGVGLNLPAMRKFQLQAELTGSAYKGADFEQTKPLDLVVGPVLYIKPGLFIRPAVSWNLNFDDRGLNSSSKSFTGRQISIGYHPGTVAGEKEVAPPPPPPPPPAANRPPTVSVTCEKPVILPGETIRCRATAADPDGDPLTYAWSSSNCRISGNGPDATLDCTGVPAGTNVTVTVRVSDGRGGTAEASTQVRVEAPTRRPEAQTLCDSAGFPRNLSRLNNIDKACLDDVATRLRQEPGARVVVVGHADGSERFPEVTGRKRAEEVKDYLVKQRGVDESRISVRSAGASQPADSGTTPQARARNRRVQVIFVPQGASAPEDDD
jgi:outer membrane protein OmpA-like peptidoglycan-associated protein